MIDIDARAEWAIYKSCRHILKIAASFSAKIASNLANI